MLSELFISAHAFPQFPCCWFGKKKNQNPPHGLGPFFSGGEYYATLDSRTMIVKSLPFKKGHHIGFANFEWMFFRWWGHPRSVFFHFREVFLKSCQVFFFSRLLSTWKFILFPQKTHTFLQISTGTCTTWWPIQPTVSWFVSMVCWRIRKASFGWLEITGSQRLGLQEWRAGVKICCAKISGKDVFFYWVKKGVVWRFCF